MLRLLAGLLAALLVLGEGEHTEGATEEDEEHVEDEEFHRGVCVLDRVSGVCPDDEQEQHDENGEQGCRQELADACDPGILGGHQHQFDADEDENEVGGEEYGHGDVLHRMRGAHPYEEGKQHSQGGEKGNGEGFAEIHC